MEKQGGGGVTETVSPGAPCSDCPVGPAGGTAFQELPISKWGKGWPLGRRASSLLSSRTFTQALGPGLSGLPSGPQSLGDMQQQLQKTLTSPADAAGFLHGSRGSGGSSKDSSCDTDDFVMVPAQFPGQAGVCVTELVCVCVCNPLSACGPSGWVLGASLPGQLGYRVQAKSYGSQWVVVARVPVLRPGPPPSPPCGAPAPRERAASSVLRPGTAQASGTGPALPKPCPGVPGSSRAPGH